VELVNWQDHEYVLYEPERTQDNLPGLVDFEEEVDDEDSGDVDTEV